ncbi:MAG TPA: SDR family oxidoreductase [Pseudonocardiaceae bacterium]|jgi:NAD(P)-dependent dehydrogenase (short-subunit alcohol dehydrogenase family)|nr:SDR family oxidoreductase [Pseudonocardiaceae bacterium]
MTTRFESKVIVITGGSSGIGRAVAERVASEGAAVVIGARRQDVGDEVVATIRAAGGQAVFLATDGTVEADVAELIRTAVTEFGRLDGAFNNVGGVHTIGVVQKIDDVAWRADLDQNLTSVFYCLKYQIPAIMASGGGGAIVNNASIAGSIGIRAMSPYVAAKHGVVGLTRAAALECASQGLRVNALVTGEVDTPLFRSLLGAPPDGELAAEAMNPVGRISQPDEIAAFVAFLLSDESAFITGAALAIDGGCTAQ